MTTPEITDTAISHVKADESERFVAFIVETFMWTGIYFLLSSAIDTPYPPYLEFLGTWPLFIAYKAYMVHQHGSHFGHMVAGIQIVDYRTGGKPRLSQVLARTIPELSYELLVPLIINAFMVIVRDDHRHSFDLFAGTIAVKRREDTTDVEYSDDEPTPPPEKKPEPDDPILYREPEPYRETRKPRF